MFEIDDFWNIMEYLEDLRAANDDPDQVTSDLDERFKTTAIDRKQVVTRFFERTLDQIVYSTNDYFRLRNFLIDWDTAFKTIMKIQENITDLYVLPDDYLNEILASFGFTFDRTRIERQSKINLILDLVNLYKGKGTPNSIHGILSYFNLMESDLVEYWLEENVDNELVFKSRRTISSLFSDDDFPSTELSFSRVKNMDPHWMQTEAQIRALMNTEVIGLPSITPYFSIRPIVSYTNMLLIHAIIQNQVQEEYSTYQSSGISGLTRDISISGTLMEVSLLELYLAICYMYLQLNPAPAGVGGDGFTCYDGSETTWTAIYAEWNALMTRPTDRDDQKSKLLQFDALFSRLQTLNFFTYATVAEDILKVLNSELYGECKGRLPFPEQGEEFFATLLEDLSDYVLTITSVRMVSYTSWILGTGLIGEIKNIVNFFKPYRARSLDVGAVYILDDPLRESLFVEDKGDELDLTINQSIVDALACRKPYDEGCYYDEMWPGDEVTISVIQY